MPVRSAFVGMVGLLVLGGGAQADVMGSGALFDKNQAEASCTVVNLSSAAVNLNDVSIVSSDGTAGFCPIQELWRAATRSLLQRQRQHAGTIHPLLLQGRYGRHLCCEALRDNDDLRQQLEDHRFIRSSLTAKHL